MEITGNLIPKFVFKRKGKFDKFILHIILAGIKYNSPNLLD
jgi:hypothetical protein